MTNHKKCSFFIFIKKRVLRNYYAALVIFYLSLNINFAQKVYEKELYDSYSRYFELDRETIFLHVNKTIFLKGEKIWFSGYVYNTKTGRPFTHTTNIVCGIYDLDGKLLEQKVFHANEGFLMGQMDIPLQLKSGEFYLKASTKRIKKFKGEGSFVQKLILRNSKVKAAQKNGDDHYKLNLFPEGGHLVENTVNTIGFLVTDQKGKGIPIKNAKLVSNNSVVLPIIKSDDQGIGKFRLNLVPDSNHHLEVELMDSTRITKKLSKIEKQGITISVNNLFTDKIAILITTNDATLERIEDKQLFIAVHRDGLLSLNSFKLKSNKKTLHIGTDNLQTGINIITLFDHNLNPIAERLFFNDRRIKVGNITSVSTAQKKIKDSIKVRLNLYSEISSPTKLSLSVLPEETQSNNNHKSIFSSFLFDPYLKSTLKNPVYYLKNTTRKKRYELDNLLLTKGWSKYDWKNIFESPPQEKFEFEKGISLSGSVANATKKKFKLVVNDSRNQYQYFTEIDDKKNFEIPNTIFYNNDTIQARLFDLKGSVSKPKIVFAPVIEPEKDALNVKWLENKFSLTNEVSEVFNFNFENQQQIDNLIALENVTVSAPKTRNKYIPITNSGMTVVFPEAERGSISGFVMKLGFRVSLVDGSGVPDGKVHVFSKRGGRVSVLVDGFYDDGFYDKRIEEVAVVAYQFPDGPIIVYSKQRKPIEQVAKHLLKGGFERPQVFYNPDYKIASTEYLKYGVVFWNGQLKINEGRAHEFIIPSNGLKNLKLFIEGMSEDGTLFSEVQTISQN